MAFGSMVDTPEGRSVHVLGVRIQTMNSKQVIEQLLYWIADRSRRMMITAGPEFVMMANSNPEVQKVARSADIITPDGVGVLWAARRNGHILPERVTGVEVTLGLLETANQRRQNLRVYVLGASSEALNACLATFHEQFPTCEFRGHHGYFSASEWPSLRADIEAFAPQLWLVGLGQPRQETLIYENLKHLPPCVAIGVGGSIDVWGGVVKRAPQVFRRLNLEWLHRLLKQPTRWKRQLALPRFVWHVLKNSGPRA